VATASTIGHPSARRGAGCRRRHHMATNEPSPSTRSATIPSVLCSDHVFVAPLAIGAVASIHSFTAPLRWVDQTRSLAALTDHPLSADEWARAATTLLVWMAIPLAIGAWRLVKGEVR
jgi:hypothetical protein